MWGIFILYLWMFILDFSRLVDIFEELNLDRDMFIGNICY